MASRRTGPGSLGLDNEFDTGVYLVSMGGNFVGVLSVSNAWEWWGLLQRISSSNVTFALIQGKTEVTTGTLADFTTLLAGIPEAQGKTLKIWSLHVETFVDGYAVPTP